MNAEKDAGRNTALAVKMHGVYCLCADPESELTADDYLAAEIAIGHAADLRARLLALADEWEEPVEGRAEYAHLAFLCAADELRGALDGFTPTRPIPPAVTDDGGAA